MVATAERSRAITNDRSVLFVSQNEFITPQIASPVRVPELEASPIDRLRQLPFMDYRTLNEFTSFQIADKEDLVVPTARIISAPGLKNWATSNSDLNIIVDKAKIVASGKIKLDEIEIPLFEYGDGAYIVASNGGVMVAAAKLNGIREIRAVVRKAKPSVINIKYKDDFEELIRRKNAGLWSGILREETSEEKTKHGAPPAGFSAIGFIEDYSHVAVFTNNKDEVERQYRNIGAGGKTKFPNTPILFTENH